MKPAPAPLVPVWTRLAPTSRSLAFVVANAPLLLLVLLPWAPTAASTGLLVAMPRYSATRMSGNAAGALNVTVTVFAFAAAAAMLDA